MALADIAGRCLALAQDQHGSRFIQQQLEVASAADKSQTFEELKPHFQTLMTNVFGNYVVQKFLEHGSTEEKCVVPWSKPAVVVLFILAPA